MQTFKIILAVLVSFKTVKEILDRDSWVFHDVWIFSQYLLWPIFPDSDVLIVLTWPGQVTEAVQLGHFLDRYIFFFFFNLCRVSCCKRLNSCYHPNNFQVWLCVFTTSVHCRKIIHIELFLDSGMIIELYFSFRTLFPFYLILYVCDDISSVDALSYCYLAMVNRDFTCFIFALLCRSKYCNFI